MTHMRENKEIQRAESEPDDLFPLSLQPRQKPLKELIRPRDPTPLDVTLGIPGGSLERRAQHGRFGRTRGGGRGGDGCCGLSGLLRFRELGTGEVLGLGGEVLSGVERRVGPGFGKDRVRSASVRVRWKERLRLTSIQRLILVVIFLVLLSLLTKRRLA